MHQTCTIIASNYIPQALTFLESFRNYHPDTPCTILVTDFAGPVFNLDIHTKVIGPANLGVEENTVAGMHEYYDQVEFATSLKPFLLQHILEHGAVTATFFDPDVKIFASFDDIFLQSQEFDAILTPHRITPFRSGSSFYQEDTFLKYGTYNLGFISVSDHSGGLLKWWSERLIYNSTRYLNDHVFTDQKWANQFPAYFNCKIYKGLGINVAPWNLDERELNMKNGIAYCGDEVLRMVHFSQMSSLLARGEDTNLWGKSFPFESQNSESLQIIKEITTDYASSLKSKSLENVIPGNWIGSKNASLSVYFRNSLRKQKMSKNSSPSLFSKYVRKNLGKITFFDKSETFSAIVNNFPMEFRKIIFQELPRIFQRK